MKTPSFWQTRNPFSDLLLPASALYGNLGTLSRMGMKPLALPIPVICVGNLTAGGAGKTPVAMALGQMLRDRNIAAFFLSKGYGGSTLGPTLVNHHLHTARNVGDEPLLLAGVLPTVVARDRKEGALFAFNQGARAIIMDDGFQNPSLKKTLSLLVIDGTSGLGNGRLIPAGPLRETPEAGFRRADAVIVVNPTSSASFLPTHIPVLNAFTEPAPSAQSLKGKSVVAFCGLAYPQKFFTTLQSLGAQILETAEFPDHHLYKHSEIKKLSALARTRRAVLVTTAKDAVRLSTEMRPLVTVVDISLHFEKPHEMHAILDKALA